MNTNRFQPKAAFRPVDGYELLPFRFIRFDSRQYIAVNEVGEYALLDRADLEALVEHRIASDSDQYRALKAKHLLRDVGSTAPLDLLALKYRMGDLSLRLGHLEDDSYEEVMTGTVLLEALGDTLLDAAPMCSDCAFAPYCGADPAFHRATQGDLVGHKALSDFCKRQMGALRHVIGLLESDDAETRQALLSWVQ